MSITLRFVRANDPVSAWIRRGMDGFPYSHTEAVLPDGSLLGAHANGGVAIRPAGYDKAYCVGEALMAINVSPAQEAAFYAYLHSQVGAPYDMAAIWDLAEGAVTSQAPPADHDIGEICSALQGLALLRASIIPFLETGKETTPRDMFAVCTGLGATLVKTGETVTRIC